MESEFNSSLERISLILNFIYINGIGFPYRLSRFSVVMHYIIMINASEFIPKANTSYCTCEQEPCDAS